MLAVSRAGRPSGSRSGVAGRRQPHGRDAVGQRDAQRRLDGLAVGTGVGRQPEVVRAAPSWRADRVPGSTGTSRWPCRPPTTIPAATCAADDAWVTTSRSVSHSRTRCSVDRRDPYSSRCSRTLVQPSISSAIAIRRCRSAGDARLPATSVHASSSGSARQGDQRLPSAGLLVEPLQQLHMATRPSGGGGGSTPPRARPASRPREIGVLTVLAPPPTSCRQAGRRRRRGG